ncbi:hypothetical protein [Bacillus sp. Y1]
MSVIEGNGKASVNDEEYVFQKGDHFILPYRNVSVKGDCRVNHLTPQGTQKDPVNSF